ncbi:MAG: TetR/AcrR family transcriptional regulator [Microbacterium sp.]
MQRRGSYAKGIAKREEILQKALDVVAREGFRGASVKQIADAVGLSQAGMLHYFASKEELFTEILRKRDEVDQAVLSPEESVVADLGTMCEGLLAIVRHNAAVPGLVHLFSQVAVDAADPDHPGHEYVLQRGQTLREAFSAAIAEAQAAGIARRDLDADTLARLVQAAADGLQLQWMVDPSVDMADALGTLFDLIAPPGRLGA